MLVAPLADEGVKGRQVWLAIAYATPDETAKGIRETVAEGAKYTGEKLKESGEAAEAPTKNAWDKVKGGAQDFGHSVKKFFTRLFMGPSINTSAGAVGGSRPRV